MIRSYFHLFILFTVSVLQKAISPSYLLVQTSSFEPTIVILICIVVHRHVHPTWRAYAN